VTGRGEPLTVTPSGLILHGSRRRREVALTFDADMTPYMHSEGLDAYDPAVVSELRASKTPATIFVSGLWAEAYPDVLRSLARDSLFEIGNHSLSHAAFKRPCFGLPVAESESQKRAEVTEAASLIHSIAGVRTRYFRFPGGCCDDADVELVNSLGQRPVQWDVLSGDAFECDPLRLAHRIVERMSSGSIVVMHLNGSPNAPVTALALKFVISALQERRLRPVTLSELLAYDR
jgi:peptidoglycan/xylan/chitin deacetylase (PgdA/CDA1 family)